MATKQACKNHPSFTYSGKESSPLGLGYSAEAEDPGTVMEGRDKTMWMVGIRNGVRIWNRVPSQIVATVTKPMAKEEVVIAGAVPPEPAAAPPLVKKPRAAPKKKAAAAVVPIEEEAQPDAAPPPVAEEVVVLKKRAPPKKKVVVAEPPVPVPSEEVVAAPVEEKKKPKKAAPKKQAVEQAAEADAAVEGEKKKKAPNNFNIYMSFRTDQLKREDPSLDHKQRFQQASNEWKLLDDARKQELVEQARAWKLQKDKADA